MHKRLKAVSIAAAALCALLPAHATIEGSLDPPSVVAQWSNSSTYPKVIDINFSDDTWPDTWKGETGVDCPDFAKGGYVNAVIKVGANGKTDVQYPVLFHNCTFATKKSYNGFAGATAAFCRQYYLGQNWTGNAATNYNNWTVAGHTMRLEDNITYDNSGNPSYGEAGFVQMCRDAATTVDGQQVSQHGWMEIDHIPYVERVQWSWSSTSWGRGIKCDYKVGDGDWQPLVWMGSEKHKNGWTCFSDQGYFMENVINASDVSLRWRVWDGEDPKNPVQVGADGKCPFTTSLDPMAQRQAPRVHKIQIFGSEITAAEAQYAAEHPVSDVGKLSDIGSGTGGDETVKAPDENAPVVISTVAQDGTGDYTKIQDAINAIPDGSRGIIYIRPGVYEENVYAGYKSTKNKYISLIGEDKATTILTSGVSRGDGSKDYTDCAALNVFTSRFYAQNLTIRNTSGNVGQAEALYTNGDAHVFNNCLLSGYQDTYKANTGSRGYFTNCTIEGATDFIYDGGMEWFDDCTLRLVKGGGYITAPAESGMPMTKVMYPELSADKFYPGLFFRNCTVTAADGVKAGDYYLGRPWKEGCGSMFLECKLPAAINAKGWQAWGGTENKASLYEYKSVDATTGSLADVSGRASFSRQATDAEVEAYINPDFLFGKYSKVPFDYKKILRGAAAPMNFVVTPTEITWESDDNAAAYIIYKDGAFLKLTTERSLAKAADGNAKYSVASVSKKGVVSKAVLATDALRITAFPTAEGFGKYATGGRGGKVVKVTSLADDGSKGTLRWAFQQYPGEPITIVFAVSGDIRLQDQLRVNRADWTLAGQTAPGDGIVITHNKINLGGSQNFIVRNVRFRGGNKDVNGEILQDQALGSENCSNYIFDHCVVGWSIEENMNTQDCHFLTVQNTMIHEGLYNAGHKKGSRGYGTQWGGSPATYYRNLLADNKSRSPRINGARGEDYVVFMEYINNVNYNFGGNGGCYGGENTANITSYNGKNSAHECNFMGNYYKPGPASSKSSVVFVNSSYARSGATSWGPAKWYVNGNVVEGDAQRTADNWKAMTAEHYSLDEIRVNERIVPQLNYYKYSAAGNVGTYDPAMYMIYNVESGEQAYETVMQNVGTVNRDQIEKRVLQEVRTGQNLYGGSTIGANKGIIDTPEDCEGFISYSSDYTVPLDTDADGIPDEWERQHGLDPNVADQNMVNAQGYTALEVYLNSLMGEEQPAEFHVNAISAPTAVPQLRYDAQSKTLHVSDNAVGSLLKVYTTAGRLLSSRQITSESISLADVKESVFLIRVDGGHTAPRVMKLANK